MLFTLALLPISDPEDAKGAKNMESIKAVSAFDDSVLKQAPMQDTSIQNESSVSKYESSQSALLNVEQNLKITTTAETTRSDNLVTNHLNSLNNENSISLTNNEKNSSQPNNESSVNTILAENEINAGPSSPQTASMSKQIVGLEGTSSNSSVSISKDEGKETKNIEELELAVSSNLTPVSGEVKKNENMENFNPSSSSNVITPISEEIKELETNVAASNNFDSAIEQNIASAGENVKAQIDISEEIVNSSALRIQDVIVDNAKSKNEMNSQDLSKSAEIISGDENTNQFQLPVNGEVNTVSFTTSGTPSSSSIIHLTNQESQKALETNLQQQGSSDDSLKNETAAFTTEINVHIIPSIQSTEEEVNHDSKQDRATTNIVVVEPKKIYVEKSSTVIQVLDVNSSEYAETREKGLSASESDSGTSDNNDYEFVDADEFSTSTQHLNTSASEKRAHRNSISTLSIMLVNHTEINQEPETSEADANESEVDQNVTSVEKVAVAQNSKATESISNGQDSTVEVDNEATQSEENKSEQYKAVLVSVDKPFGTKLSRKQKKSMKELQKIARERAKTKLISQLSTSSSESNTNSITESNEYKAVEVERLTTELNTEVEIDTTTIKPNILEPLTPIKSTTVVQLAQNSSKTVPVPPKRPSKIPISRQRSNSKVESKPLEQPPSKIPVKASSVKAVVTQKAPETPNAYHTGEATPEFTNSASIVLKPGSVAQKGTLRNSTLQSQKSEEIASEMENSVQIVKDLNRKFSMAQNKSLSKKSSIDSTTSSKQLSYTKSLDNDSDSSVSDSNVEELLEHSSDEGSYEEFGEYEEEIIESDTDDYNNFERENLKSATELNINLSQISQKVDELTSNLNHEKRTNFKKPNSYIEETCESSEDYLSEEELEDDDESEGSSENDDIKHLTEKLNNDLNVEIKQPTELELMQVRPTQING